METSASSRAAKEIDTHRLVELYKEVCLLQLKYQHLQQLCTVLQDPWPNRNRLGKLQKKETEGKQPEVHKDSAVQEESQVSDARLQALEDILQKAQRIRISQNEKNTVQEGSECLQKKKKKKDEVGTMTARSLKMAISAYGGTASGPSIIRSNMGMGHKTAPLPNKRTKEGGAKAASCHNTQQPINKTSATSATKGQKTLLKRASGEDKPSLLPPLTLNEANPPSSSAVHPCLRSSKAPPLVKGPAATNRTPFESSSVGVGSVSRGCSTILEGKDEGDRFVLMSHGSRLSMPQSYVRVHKRLDRINEIFKSSDTFDPEADKHFKSASSFFKRVNNPSKGEREWIKMQIEVKELQLVKEHLNSFTPHQWTALPSCQWQDVLRMKRELELIQTTVVKNGVAMPPPYAPCTLTGDTLTTPTDHASSLAEPAEGEGGSRGEREEALALSSCVPQQRMFPSFESWLEMVSCEQRRMLLRFEEGILELCAVALLPKLRAMNPEESLYPMILRLSYDLMGLEKHKPFFVVSSSSHTQTQTQTRTQHK